MELKLLIMITLVAVLSFTGCAADYNQKNYVMPSEEEEHQATFLQWPHQHTYGLEYMEQLEPIWVEMAVELSKSEDVNIVVYDDQSKERVLKLMESEGADIERLNFFVYQTDDVWVRDNGPIFVRDTKDKLVMLDFGFNGWGEKTNFEKCLDIPKMLSKDMGFEYVNIHDFVLEGGAIELDGNGTLLTTRSSVSNKNRNPNLTEEEMNIYFKTYFSATNIVWLDGVEGLDITDFHIDGFAKFFDENTLLTLDEEDLIEWGVTDSDIELLLNLKNADGNQYEHVILPLTDKNVVLSNGKKLGYKGSYLNFYIANNVVLVPNYNDVNDEVANEIIQSLYPNRKVVGIDVRELYQYGGIIHCVTQQQPLQ